jgi:CBS domain-containing protein
MRTADVAELLVIDNGRLVGTVSERDIWQHCPTSALLLDGQQADYLLAQFRIGGVMTLHPSVITPETPLSEAAQLLAQSGRSGLPVVEEGTLIGFLRETDVMQALAMLVKSRGSEES